MKRAQPAAAIRLTNDPGCIASSAASGRNTTMFIAMSFGFCMIPPTDPITRVPPRITLTPRA